MSESEILQEIDRLKKKIERLKESLNKPIKYRKQVSISKVQFNSLVYRDPDIYYRIV